MTLLHNTSRETLETSELHRLDLPQPWWQQLNRRHPQLVLGVDVRPVLHEVTIHLEKPVDVAAVPTAHGAHVQCRVPLVVHVVDRTPALQQQPYDVGVGERREELVGDRRHLRVDGAVQQRASGARAHAQRDDAVDDAPEAQLVVVALVELLQQVGEMQQQCHHRLDVLQVAYVDGPHLDDFADLAELVRRHLEDVDDVGEPHRFARRSVQVLLVDLPEELTQRLQREQTLVVERFRFHVPQMEGVLPHVHAPLVVVRVGVDGATVHEAEDRLLVLGAEYPLANQQRLHVDCIRGIDDVFELARRRHLLHVAIRLKTRARRRRRVHARVVDVHVVVATQTVGAPPALERLRDAVLLVDEVRADQLVGLDLARDVRVDAVDQELNDVLVAAQARRLQRVVAEIVAD